VEIQCENNNWTLMAGSLAVNQSGVYDKQDNVPGARYGAVGCYDSLNKEFWLFGGEGFGNDSQTSCALIL